MKTAEERFWSKVNIDNVHLCWEWTACKRNRKRGLRYGYFKLGGKLQYAHRVAWTLINGEIPEGLCVLHKCDNPSCVNPFHLFLGTNADNMRDKCQKGRHFNGNSAKTHCPQGHPYAGDNLITKLNGGRRCKKCRVAQNRARYL